MDVFQYQMHCDLSKQMYVKAHATYAVEIKDWIGANRSPENKA